MNRIALLTSGGDAPGMNNAIRGVVRTALSENLQVIGFQRGYEGLIHNEYRIMDSKSVGSILEKGGTILRTYRSKLFKEPEGQQRAIESLNGLNVDGLVVIGGDGSFRGAQQLDQNWKGSVIGIPATIDNDIAGTDFCLGFNTATNTALRAVDKIRDTATSHQRTFIVEVMGRNSGHLALAVGLSGGAEEILVPEKEFKIDQISNRIEQSRDKGKLHYLIVMAEGAGDIHKVADEIEQRNDRQTRVVVLGHVQRGGAPTSRDRIAGGKMGYSSVQSLLHGKSGVSVGLNENQKTCVPLEKAVKGKHIDENILEIASTLST